MPDYILRIIRESNDAPAMTTIINVAKHKALTELFLDEGYVVYDCFACQYTKNYGELFLDEVDEKNCHSGICLDHHQADSDSRGLCGNIAAIYATGAQSEQFVRMYTME